MDKVSFSRSKISLISRFAWIISALAGCCKRKLLRLQSKKTLHSGTELISEFPKEWVIITKILFCRDSYYFCLFGEFAKVLESQVRVVICIVQRVHFQVRVGVFNCQQILTKICLVVFSWWDAINIMCFFHIVKLYAAKIKYTRSFDNSINKIEIFFRVDLKSVIVTLLIIFAVFTYFQLSL